MKPILKFLFGLAAAFVLVVGVYGAYLYFFKIDPMLNKIGTPEAVPAGKSATNKPLAILLLGLDTRPEEPSKNTDVIMVAGLNPETKQAVIVSIPRDTYIKGTKGLRGNKANAFYANLHAINAKTAKTQIKDVFGDYLGVPIDYVSMIDFQGFRDIVDALGGVTVDVDMDMRYVDNADGTDINLKKGVQMLNGRQALDFVRYRKSNRGTAESNDIQRNERQQKVISAVIGKLKSPEGILKLGGVFDAVGDNLSTDIQKSQLLNMMRTYIGVGGDKIQYIHLDGEWRSPYMYIQTEDLNKARQALRTVLREP